jgi:hypothetical protein
LWPRRPTRTRSTRAVRARKKLAPLSRCSETFGDGIARGQVGPEHPLHLPERVAASLPSFAGTATWDAAACRGRTNGFFPRVCCRASRRKPRRMDR